MGIVSGFVRLVFPITAATYLIKAAFRLGQTQKRDKYACTPCASRTRSVAVLLQPCTWTASPVAVLLQRCTWTASPVATLYLDC